jgi:hypothetical protein
MLTNLGSFDESSDKAEETLTGAWYGEIEFE